MILVRRVTFVLLLYPTASRRGLNNYGPPNRICHYRPFLIVSKLPSYLLFIRTETSTPDYHMPLLSYCLWASTSEPADRALTPQIRFAHSYSPYQSFLIRSSCLTTIRTHDCNSIHTLVNESFTLICLYVP